MLGLNQSVDSLERMNVQMAEQVTAFREERPRPDPDTEGAILVTSADGWPARGTVDATQERRNT